jgi:hypothetical protein
VPGGVAKTFIQTKEPELKNPFDEWLARIVCYAFSVSHQAFVNQTNRSTGETQKEMADPAASVPLVTSGVLPNPPRERVPGEGAGGAL